MTHKDAKQVKQKIIDDILMPSLGENSNNAFTQAAESRRSFLSEMRESVTGLSLHSDTSGQWRIRLYAQEALPLKEVVEYLKVGEASMSVENIGLPYILKAPHPGDYISHPGGAIGTLACYVKDADKRIHVLSNNHVLTNFCSAKVGDCIPYPGVRLTGANDFARISKIVPISFSSKINLVDCATAELIDQQSTPRTDINRIGLLEGTMNPAELLQVQKCGNRRLY
jgi:hypothetical protein